MKLDLSPVRGGISVGVNGVVTNANGVPIPLEILSSEVLAILPDKVKGLAEAKEAVAKAEAEADKARKAAEAKAKREAAKAAKAAKAGATE